MKFLRKLLVVILMVSILAPTVAVNIPKNHFKMPLLANGNDEETDYEGSKINIKNPTSTLNVRSA